MSGRDVIAGLRYGVEGMRVGGLRRLTISPPLRVRRGWRAGTDPAQRRSRLRGRATRRASVRGVAKTPPPKVDGGRVRNSITNKRMVSVSKCLAKHLRHAPHELGLKLQPGGWVPVDDQLAAAENNGSPISYDELVERVETND